MNNFIFNDFNNECLRCPSWRGLFEQPKRLHGWISFHLWAGVRSKEMALVSYYCARHFSCLYKKNGALWLAKYLKVSKLAIYRSLGGISLEKPYTQTAECSYKPSSKMVPVALNRYGLPKWVLPRHRRMMLGSTAESDKWIRCYVTLCDLYKFIIVPVTTVDVDSIYAPPSGATVTLPRPGNPMGDPKGWLDLIPNTRPVDSYPLVLGLGSKLFWSAGPNTESHLGALTGWVNDAQALLEHLHPLELVLYDFLFRPQVRYLSDPEPDDLMPGLPFKHFLIRIASHRPDIHLSVGKVGVKHEPAGKVRLFMIMDSISQRLLYPLHEWVFKMLRRIPNDGTFSQLSPLRHLKGVLNVHSFDLRSATDRVPIAACASFLESFWGSDIALAWRAVLRRPFTLPKGVHTKQGYKTVSFTTGTPLGSLSSWGIFTLYHHFLVQQAAYSVSRKREWFTKYAILGDDLVIGCPNVAWRYSILLKILAVDISLEKSIVSENGTLEFASRFLFKGRDLSPISFKSLIAARASLALLPSFFRRVREFRPIRLVEYFRLSNAGYKVAGMSGLPYDRLYLLSKKWLRLWLIIHHPHSDRPLSWTLWFSAGRKKLIPPEAIGVLHFELFEAWCKSIEETPWSPKDIHYEGVPFWEECVRAPWLTLHLKQVKDTSLRLINGELIDPPV